MQVSPFKTKRSTQPSIFDMAKSFRQVNELVKQLEDIKNEHNSSIEAHKANLAAYNAEFEQIVAAKIAEIDVVLQKILEIQKGEPGKDAEPVDIDAVIQSILSQIKIPIPKDGKPGRDAVVDEESIVKKVIKKIPKPEPVKAPKIDHDAIVEKIFQLLDTGKKKLSTKHIGDFNTGLEQTIAPIRSLAAGFRGGGDVVKAGSNITITTDADGKKVIASTSSSITVYTETPSGLINGSNTTYTTAHTITNVYSFAINGQFLHPTTDYTFSGTTITMATALPASLSGTPFTITYS